MKIAWSLLSLQHTKQGISLATIHLFLCIQFLFSTNHKIIPSTMKTKLKPPVSMCTHCHLKPVLVQQEVVHSSTSYPAPHFVLSQEPSSLFHCFVAMETLEVLLGHSSSWGVCGTDIHMSINVLPGAHIMNPWL